MPSVQTDKARVEPPTADIALLGFLIGMLSLVSIFAFGMYQAMRPTVLVNAGASAFESNTDIVGLGKDKSVIGMFASRPSIDKIEQSEVAAALVENERQGLKSVAFASQELSSQQPQRDSAKKFAKQRPPAKPKRVVRVQRPDPDPFGQHAWAFGPTGSRSFGGFGSWYR